MNFIKLTIFGLLAATAVGASAEVNLFPASLALSSLDGVNGTVLKGIDADDWAGWAGDGIGDVNGDGLDDLIVTAMRADPDGRVDAGESYVVFGRPSGLGASLDLASLDGTNGFTIKGMAAGDWAGYSVGGGVDVNADGTDDIVVGAFKADPSPDRPDAGQTYVIFGSTSGFAAGLDLASLDGTAGFAINGIAPGDSSGISVSGAGDVNDDGIDDLLIGAYRGGPETASNESDIGEAYIVYGSAAGFGATLELADLNGANGFPIKGVSGRVWTGISVSGAGDMNADGIGDLIVGAPGAQWGDWAGRSYVIFGTPSGFGAQLDLATLDGTNGFAIDGAKIGDWSGYAVDAAGDVNGDGYDDVVIGAWFADAGDRLDRVNGYVTDAGKAYVVFGPGAPVDLPVADLDGTNGFAMTGAEQMDRSGYRVSGAGDMNGDGVDDLIVSAHQADADGRTGAGKGYVVFGASTGFGADIPLASLDGSNGFAIHGADIYDNAGISVAGAGDINGDGVDDLLVGAWTADPDGRSNAGKGYIVYGRSLATPLSLGVTPGTIAENGGTATATVTRSGDTSQALVVDLASSDPGMATVPASVTIAAGSAGADFTVSAVDDEVAENGQSVTITATAAGHTEATAVVDISDDDVAGITISPIAGLTTTEAGASAIFSLVLDSQPTADVTIALTSSDPGEGTPSPASVTFTDVSWSESQTVTVTGIDDTEVDGPVAYTIVTGAAVSADGQYAGLNPADVGVVNTDDDTVAPTVKLETGVVPGVGDAWQTVTLDNDYVDMVVIASVNLPSQTDVPGVVRVRNASPNSFEVRVQNPSGKPVPGYDLHYLAVEAGIYTQAEHGVTLEAGFLEATETAENNKWVLEPRGYRQTYTNPVVLGQVMTVNDPDWSVFWSSDPDSRTTTPHPGGFAAGKHVGEDPDNTRAAETLGYVVIETGSGLIGDMQYTAAIGPPTVAGVDNSGVGFGYALTGLSGEGAGAVVSAAAMAGTDGGWPVLFGPSPVDNTQLVLAFDEDQLNNSERRHIAEPVAYFAFSRTLVNQPPTATFTATPTSGEAPLTVDVDASASFDGDGTIQTYSWDFGDGSTGTGSTASHSYDTGGVYSLVLTVIDDGGATATASETITVTTPADAPQMETGIVGGVTDAWQTITLNDTYGAMVVIATVNLPSQTDLPAVTRVRNTVGNSFEIRVQNPSGDPLPGYDVHYLVVEAGIYTRVEHGVTLEAGFLESVETAENNDWILEPRSYQQAYVSPVVLGQVMTANDADWSVFWASHQDKRTTTMDADGFAAGKHVGEDPDDLRSAETLGYIVVEAGSGSVGGRPYTAAIGDPIVTGVDNNPDGVSYTLSETMGDGATAVLSPAAMVGTDGGWPVLFGPSPVNPSQLTLAIDEDQVRDAERSHTNEPVSYLVLGADPL